MPMLGNPRHEAFAQAYARGATAGRAAASYLAAGFKGDRDHAARHVGRLMNDPRVRRRIAELQRDMDRNPVAATVARGDVMPALRNPKHEAFAQAYVRGETAGNGGRSYLAAGYTCGPAWARMRAWELLKDPGVMRRIAELQQEAQAQEAQASERAIARLALSKERVLAELARIAFANMLDYVRVGADGAVEVDLARIDRDMGAAIQEVVVMPVREGGRHAPRIRLKLADKRAALADLGRHFGLFVERRQAPADEYAGLSDEELAAKIRNVVDQLRRIGIDVATDLGIGEADLGGRPPARPN